MVSKDRFSCLINISSHLNEKIGPKQGFGGQFFDYSCHPKTKFFRAHIVKNRVTRTVKMIRALLLMILNSFLDDLLKCKMYKESFA